MQSLLWLKFFVSGFYVAENPCIFSGDILFPLCGPQMSPDHFRYILCTLLVINILPLPTFSLICPWTIPLRTFISSVVMFIKSILTVQIVMSICPFLLWRNVEGIVCSGGVIIPWMNVIKFPQIHQINEA